MKEKNKKLIDEFLNSVSAEYRELFYELAAYAVSLGYTPKKTGTKNFGLDFSKRKVKKTIMKFEDHDNGISTRGPGLRLRFYASKNYSEIFNNGIKRVVEEFGGKNTGCRHCGGCSSVPEGYTYTYPDGKKVFRCGADQMIEVYNFRQENIPEIKELLKAQDDFYLCKVSMKTSIM